MKDFY